MLKTDQASGVISDFHVDWNQVFQKAVEIAMLYSPSLGNRSLDIIHIAIAKENGFQKIITFDQRQSKLALENGLELISV